MSNKAVVTIDLDEYNSLKLFKEAHLNKGVVSIDYLCNYGYIANKMYSKTKFTKKTEAKNKKLADELGELRIEVSRLNGSIKNVAFFEFVITLILLISIFVAMYNDPCGDQVGSLIISLIFLMHALYMMFFSKFRELILK